MPSLTSSMSSTSLLLLLLSSCTLSIGCPCENLQDCEHPEEDYGVYTEVMAFSNGSTEVELWQWTSITTLVVPSSFDIKNPTEANTMCVAHQNGKKFSITVDMDLTAPLSETSPDAKAWLDNVSAQYTEWHAEMVTVDLLDFLNHPSSDLESDHTALAHILKNAKDNLDALTDISVKMACVVPWKPPCAEDSSTCYFAYLSNDVCDFFIINPDSFEYHDDTICTARATIPITKLLYGISEYNLHHIPRGKIVLGVPWHAYDYVCDKFENNICTLKIDPQTNKCHFDQRMPVSSSDIMMQHGIMYDTHLQSDVYSSPNYSYTEASVTHQVWYEDEYSMGTKYRLVKELGLKGVAIMYGDDLSHSLTAHNVVNGVIIWNWVHHEFFVTSSASSELMNFHYADITGGVAVGCLLLGTFLGFLFTYLGLRYRIRRPKNAFLRPHDVGLTDEFHDEDDRPL